MGRCTQPPALDLLICAQRREQGSTTPEGCSEESCGLSATGAVTWLSFGFSFKKKSKIDEGAFQRNILKSKTYLSQFLAKQGGSGYRGHFFARSHTRTRTHTLLHYI